MARIVKHRDADHYKVVLLMPGVEHSGLRTELWLYRWDLTHGWVRSRICRLSPTDGVLPDRLGHEGVRWGLNDYSFDDFVEPEQARLDIAAFILMAAAS